jgi:hypothetical protein
MNTVVTHPDASVRVEENNGKRVISVEPRDGLFTPIKKWVTDYPPELIEYVLRIKGQPISATKIMRGRKSALRSAPFSPGHPEPCCERRLRRRRVRNCHPRPIRSHRSAGRVSQTWQGRPVQPHQLYLARSLAGDRSPGWQPRGSWRDGRDPDSGQGLDGGVLGREQAGAASGARLPHR